MLKHTKALSVTIATIMMATFVPIVSVNAENIIDNKREIIATFNFENTEMVTGEAVTKYFSESADPIKYFGSDYTNYYMSESEKAFIIDRSKHNQNQTVFSWSENTYTNENNTDLGIQPSNDRMEFVTDVEGYQNIELSFDLAVTTSDGNDSIMTLESFNNDYIQMPEYREFNVESGNQMKQYKFAFASSWIEDKHSQYNKLFFMLNSSDSFVINNITLTGIKYDTSKGRSYIYGDANSDCIVNIDDATLLQKHLAELDGVYYKEFSSPYRYFCDVNKDYKLDINDVTLVQKYIVGESEYIGIIGQVVPVTPY